MSHPSRALTVFLAVFLAIGCSSDSDGVEEYVQDIIANSPFITVTDPQAQVLGTTLVIDFVLKDPQSRDVRVSVQFSIDGGDIWFIATAAPGSQNDLILASDTVGIAYQFEWDHFADLGVSTFSNARFRVRPLDPNGTSGVSTPFELTSFGALTTSEVRTDLYADLADASVDDLVLADTRVYSAYAMESIPGAISIPLADVLANGIDAFKYPDGTSIPLDKRLIFYCTGTT